MASSRFLQGNKMNDIDVVYTMWSNLKKTDGMDVGQVGFHKQVRPDGVPQKLIWIKSNICGQA
jgi:hypothetical protein